MKKQILSPEEGRALLSKMTRDFKRFMTNAEKDKKKKTLLKIKKSLKNLKNKIKNN